jgi:hypothetical protein
LYVFSAASLYNFVDARAVHRSIGRSKNRSLVDPRIYSNDLLTVNGTLYFYIPLFAGAKAAAEAIIDARITDFIIVKVAKH